MVNLGNISRIIIVNHILAHVLAFGNIGSYLVSFFADIIIIIVLQLMIKSSKPGSWNWMTSLRALLTTAMMIWKR